MPQTSVTDTNRVVGTSVGATAGFKVREVAPSCTPLLKSPPRAVESTSRYPRSSWNHRCGVSSGGLRRYQRQAAGQHTWSNRSFHTIALAVSVAVAPGTPVLIGGGMPSRDGKALVYAFLTVRRSGSRRGTKPRRQNRAVEPGTAMTNAEVPKHEGMTKHEARTRGTTYESALKPSTFGFPSGFRLRSSI